MTTPVSTQHYNSHLGNNDGEQDDNNIQYKKGIGCITPYYTRRLIKKENVSISPCPGEATRSLETSPI